MGRWSFQQRGRLEVDVVLERGGRLTAIGIKAGKTPSTGSSSGLAQLGGRLAADSGSSWTLADRIVVQAGGEGQHRSLDGTLQGSSYSARLLASA